MSQHLHVIVGLGKTGFSCARHLIERQIPIAVVDTREQPPYLEEFKKSFPDVPVSVGQLDSALLDRAEKLVMSPGISLREAPIARQILRGIPVIGDVELFAQVVKAPVIAITGTNAKSTVTTLVGEMAKAAGLNVKVGGNLGIPTLDLLSDPMTELFVLELSSFQLETTKSLTPKVATILNITPDHMDRYADFKDYMRAKHQVYSGCEIAICNRDDNKTDCGENYSQSKIQFTLNEPQKNEFGLRQKENEVFLAYENNLLMPVKALPILGKHYQANALAALAIGHGYGLSMEAMLQTLAEFKGLPHRCQLVRERKQVHWYNDSKGTNVGATLAAMEGLGSEISGKVILIAGGLGKNADFTSLVPAIEKYARSVVLIGEAANLLAEIIGNRVPTDFAKTMQEAVLHAEKKAQPGDSVLLSPACASFDMFKNFEHRGEVFTTLVQGLV